MPVKPLTPFQRLYFLLINLSPHHHYNRDILYTSRPIVLNQMPSVHSEHWKQLLRRRPLYRRPLSVRRWTHRRHFRVIFLRRCASASAPVYYIYRDLHINAPVCVYDKSTTTSYSHSNNTTTTTIADSFNDNSTSAIQSTILIHHK